MDNLVEYLKKMVISDNDSVHQDNAKQPKVDLKFTTDMVVEHHRQPYKQPSQQFTLMLVEHHGQPYKPPSQLFTYMGVEHHGQPYKQPIQTVKQYDSNSILDKQFEPIITKGNKN